MSIFFDWDFSLGPMSMDLSSVLAALSSHGVLLVTGTNIQVASLQACTPGLGGPEPSGTFIQPGHHLHGSRDYLNVVRACSSPPLGPQGHPNGRCSNAGNDISLPLCLKGVRQECKTND